MHRFPLRMLRTGANNIKMLMHLSALDEVIRAESCLLASLPPFTPSYVWEDGAKSGKTSKLTTIPPATSIQ